MRKIDSPLVIDGKNQNKKRSTRGRSFGYNILGFGSGGSAPTIRFLVVGGGGGGGYGNPGSGGGGAGAGGFRTREDAYPAPGQTITVTVGGGGAGSNGGNPYNAGQQSAVQGAGFTIASAGGAGGAGGGNALNGADGASGSGNSTFGGTAGQGNVPSTDPPQGFDGGQSNQPAGSGGGGGGVGVGGGGPGGQDDIQVIGQQVTFAAGGAGGLHGANVSGQGASSNTGNGGGGGSGRPHAPQNGNPGGGGGSGIVIIRVPTSKFTNQTTGSPTVTTDGGHKVMKFTGGGSYTT